MEKINKTKIEKRMSCKTDSELVATIIKLKKTNPAVAKELSKPKRKWPAINLKDIDMVEGDVLVAGKILSAGELRTPKKITAWAVSKKALEKINDSKSKFTLLTEEIKENPELKNYKILRQ